MRDSEHSSLLHRQERKVATVLFTDLVGSTSLGEMFDIEPLGQIVSAFHNAVSDAVSRCDGLAEFVGDGVVAVFGAPVAVENHQGRALRAADLILDAIEDLNEALLERHGVSLGVRIGVNTGDVLVDRSADVDLSALAGDTFNVAARLQDAAEVGEVLATRRTVASVHDRKLEDLGLIHVPGRSTPVRAYRVGKSGSFPSVVGILPELIGRRDQLALLESALLQVQETGVSRVTTLVGEAGIGKSTLLDVFLRSVAEEAGAPVAFGACRAFGRGGTLEPLAMLIDSARPGVSTANAIHELLNSEGDRHAMTLVRALGLAEGDQTTPGTPGLARRDLTSAWKTLVSALSRDETWVLAVEDLHWADPELLELLIDGVAASGRGVLLVATARSEFLTSGTRWPLDPDKKELITVTPFDSAETIRMASLLDPATDQIPGIGAALHRLTEGNPFFVTELVRSMSERGRLETLGADLANLAVPDSVQGVLADRIDRLDEDDKRVLQAAAVIGRDFWPPAIAALLDIENAAVDLAIGHLVERRMVEYSTGAAAPCRFMHALTRDVAYASIPRRHLHELHETVARWIETHSGQEADSAALIAFHLSQAYRFLEADWEADSAHVSLVRRDTARWAILAARRAITATALTEAKRLASQAIEMAADDGQLIDARECLGNAYLYGYEGDGAWEMLTSAADLAQGKEYRTAREVAAMYIRALESPVRWPGGMRHVPTPAELHAYITKADALLDADDSVERVRLLTVVAFWDYATYGRAGSGLISADEVARSAAEAADMAQRLNRPDLESGALDGLSSLHITAGDYGAASSVIHRRLRLYDRLTDPWERGDLCAVGGWVSFHTAQYEQAIEWTTRGINEVGEQYLGVALHCRTWRGLTRFRTGDWDGLLEDCAFIESHLADGVPPPFTTPLVAAAALVHYLRTDDAACDRLVALLDAYEKIDPPPEGDLPLSRWAEYLGPLVARRGDPDTALDMIQSTTWRRDSRLGPLMQARCLVVSEGRLWQQVGDLFEECRRQADEHGTPAVLATAYYSRGEFLLDRGDWEGAQEAFSQAVSLARRLGDGWVSALATLGHARSLDAAGSRQAARELAEVAAQEFERLGSVREWKRAARLVEDRG